MAIGKTGSFATVEAPQDNIMQAMQYVDQLDYRGKQDRDLKEQAKAKAQEVKNTEFKSDLEKARAVTTGKRGYDAPVIEAVSLLSTKMANDFRDLNSGKISKTDYEIKKNHLLYQVDLLKQKSNALIENTKSFSKMVEEGKIEDGFEDGVLSLGKSIDNGYIKPEIDENGNIIMMAWEVDENGEVSDIVEKSSLSDFGNSSLKPVFKVDFQQQQELFKKNNPLALVETINGQIKTGKKEVTPELDSNIRAYSQALTKDKNTLSVAYKNATGKFERDIQDEDKIKIAEDWMYNNIKNSYQKEITKDEAMGRANHALAVKKDNRDQEESEPYYNVVETPPSYAKAGVKPTPGYKTISITTQNQKPVPHITGFSNGTEQNYNNVILNSYTVEKNSKGVRSVVAEITYPDVKTSTLTADEKKAWDKNTLNPKSLSNDEQLVVSRIVKGAENKTKVVRLTEKDFVKFRGTVGAKDANEMKDLARTGEEQKLDEYGVPIN